MNEPNGHICSCPRYPRYPQAEACISRFVRLAIGDSMMTSAKRRRTRKRVQDQEVGGRIGGPGASLAMKPVGRKGRVRIALREPEPRNGASRTWSWIETREKAQVPDDAACGAEGAKQVGWIVLRYEPEVCADFGRIACRSCRTRHASPVSAPRDADGHARRWSAAMTLTRETSVFTVGKASMLGASGGRSLDRPPFRYAARSAIAWPHGALDPEIRTRKLFVG